MMCYAKTEVDHKKQVVHNAKIALDEKDYYYYGELALKKVNLMKSKRNPSY